MLTQSPSLFFVSIARASANADVPTMPRRHERKTKEQYSRKYSIWSSVPKWGCFKFAGVDDLRRDRGEKSIAGSCKASS